MNHLFALAYSQSLVIVEHLDLIWLKTCLGLLKPDTSTKRWSSVQLITEHGKADPQHFSGFASSDLHYQDSHHCEDREGRVEYSKRGAPK